VRFSPELLYCFSRQAPLFVREKSSSQLFKSSPYFFYLPAESYREALPPLHLFSPRLSCLPSHPTPSAPTVLSVPPPLKAFFFCSSPPSPSLPSSSPFPPYSSTNYFSSRPSPPPSPPLTLNSIFSPLPPTPPSPIPYLNRFPPLFPYLPRPSTSSSISLSLLFLLPPSSPPQLYPPPIPRPPLHTSPNISPSVFPSYLTLPSPSCFSLFLLSPAITLSPYPFLPPPLSSPLPHFLHSSTFEMTSKLVKCRVRPPHSLYLSSSCVLRSLWCTVPLTLRPLFSSASASTFSSILSL